MTSTPPAVAPGATAITKSKLTPPVRRLFGFITPLNIVLYTIVGAVPGMFLPLQLQALDEANKAQNLGIITGVGAAVAIVASPVLGLLSDRTRSRFGRRTPWILGGALLTGLALIFMGVANGFIQLLIGWIMVQVAINFIISPLTALLPERVPVSARGVFSTLSGIGLMLGTLGGSIYGAAMAKNISAGYLLLPGILLILVVLFVVLAPDASSKDQVNERFSIVLFLKTFWVSPRKHPDFAWGFWGRITLFTGYFLIYGYTLYILQDYIGLGEDAVSTVPRLSLVLLVAALIALAISGPLSDRVGRRKPIVIVAALLMGAGMLIPFVMPTMLGMFLYAGIAGLGFGAYLSADAALMSELLPSQDTYAKDLGVLNIAATLPQSLGPFIGSLIVVSFGYAPIFPLGLALAIVGALCIVPIKAAR
ncbi:MFS transporter [Microbacterium ulmi]|uniref:MFS transporter n=1 Tax=Microbacterium ulmi TaxID=179095 RepID=A0A7Y2Q270_9MICO|nr:MFS transporter [Microbacterium ulmi]NII68877.1 MFS family permease [Microbacterium ulmi]NNH05127.1 MFS transporter [Microbacterium ulmi]